jgi:hypothetical protein
MESIKNCESCGMPMHEPSDFGGFNPDNLYCRYCTDADGHLKSYEEVLQGFMQFTIKTQGIDPEQARLACTEHMALMPAWKDRSS